MNMFEKTSVFGFIHYSRKQMINIEIGRVIEADDQESLTDSEAF